MLYNKCHVANSKWNNLGLQLGLYHRTLSDIEDEYAKPERRMKACIDVWLRWEDKVKEKGYPSWESLAMGLERIGDKAAASKVRKEKC